MGCQSTPLLSDATQAPQRSIISYISLIFKVPQERTPSEYARSSNLIINTGWVPYSRSKAAGSWCKARWCLRHNGIVKISWALVPTPPCPQPIRWCASSAGCPQHIHGCVLTHEIKSADNHRLRLGLANSVAGATGLAFTGTRGLPGVVIAVGLIAFSRRVERMLVAGTDGTISLSL
ncbi:Uncharacterised protein [Klebsiella variicola]|nr:Uncharacterised protein [Klebsiella variicola]